MKKKCFLILFILFSKSIQSQGHQVKSKEELKKERIEFLKKYYLNDPRDHKKSEKLEYKYNCKENLQKSNSGIIGFKRLYYDCIYTYKGKTKALMSYSIYKTDSTWPFGTNGLEIYRFETNSKKFPLKDQLQVGANIEDFEKFFVPLIQKGDQYMYELKDKYWTSKLILKVSNEMVSKVTILNTYKWSE